MGVYRVSEGIIVAIHTRSHSIGRTNQTNEGSSGVMPEAMPKFFLQALGIELTLSAKYCKHILHSFCKLEFTKKGLMTSWSYRQLPLLGISLDNRDFGNRNIFQLPHGPGRLVN